MKALPELMDRGEDKPVSTRAGEQLFREADSGPLREHHGRSAGRRAAVGVRQERRRVPRGVCGVVVELREWRRRRAPAAASLEVDVRGIGRRRCGGDVRRRPPPHVRRERRRIVFAQRTGQIRARDGRLGRRRLEVGNRRRARLTLEHLVRRVCRFRGPSGVVRYELVGRPERNEALLDHGEPGGVDAGLSEQDERPDAVELRESVRTDRIGGA